MVRSKGSSRAFSSVDHVTTSSTLSCISFLFFSQRDVLSSSLYVSILFFTLSLSLSLSFSRLSSPFFRRHDRVSVPAMLRVQEFRTGKKDWEHGLPLDPNSSTSPRYFRSLVLVLLLPTKSLPCFFQLQVGTPIISRRMKFADNTRRGYTDVYFSEIPNFVISYDILPDYSSVSQLQDLLPRLRATCRDNSMGSGNDIGICGISGEDTRSCKKKRIKTVLARMEFAC